MWLEDVAHDPQDVGTHLVGAQHPVEVVGLVLRHLVQEASLVLTSPEDPAPVLDSEPALRLGEVGANLVAVGVEAVQIPR